MAIFNYISCVLLNDITLIAKTGIMDAKRIIELNKLS